MIPIRLKFRGLTRFRLPVEIDFAAMPDGLTAVAGGNGEGKTTILEAMIVAVWGVFPTRPGSVYDYLNPPEPGEVDRVAGEGGRTRKPPDAVVDFLVDLEGRRWRFRRTFDAKARSQVCQVWIDGQAVGEGKVEEAAELVARSWPPLSQVLASVFAAQGGAGSFLTLRAAARKDLIVTMLGLGRLQELATLALEDARTTAAAKDQAAQDVERAQEAEARLEAARQDLTRARQRRTAAEEADQVAAAELAAVLEALEAARTDLAAARRLEADQQAEVGRLVDAARSADAEWVDATSAHARAVDAVGELEELRAAAAPLEELRAKVAAEAEAHAVAARAVVEAGRELRQAQTDERHAGAAVARIDQEIGRIGLVDLDRARSAVDQEAQELEAARTAREAAAGLRSRLGDLRRGAQDEREARRQLADAEDRAKLLEDVPCGGEVLTWDGLNRPDLDCGACPLLVDAKRAKASIEELQESLEWTGGACDELEEAERAHAAAEDQARQAQARAGGFRGAEERLRQAERNAARLEELRSERTAAAATLAEAEATRTTAAERLRSLESDLGDPPDRTELEEAERAAKRLDAVRELAGAVDARAERQAKAERARDAAVAARDAARAKLDELRQESARLAAVVDTRERPRQRLADAAAVASRELQTASSASARAAGAVEALEHAEGQLEEARAALVVADQEAEDAALLAAVLGRDGVQAMELDAVGPAVSSIATEILRVVYGPRFVVQFVTQVAKAGAAGRRGETREVFDVRVIDDERGTDGPASRLSGGERVVVSEALKLALAVFAAQSGAALRTLVRDESDGALDDERAAHYPAMLRRAQELGGFRRVLLVSHRPSNVAACDAVLHVEDGSAVLEVA